PPGVRQKSRSAPQKHPMPNTAVRRPCGKGGAIGLPFTTCRPVTAMGRSRPGSASSAEGITGWYLPNSLIGSCPFLPGSGPSNYGSPERIPFVTVMGERATETLRSSIPNGGRHAGRFVLGAGDRVGGGVRRPAPAGPVPHGPVARGGARDRPGHRDRSGGHRVGQARPADPGALADGPDPPDGRRA